MLKRANLKDSEKALTEWHVNTETPVYSSLHFKT